MAELKEIKKLKEEEKTLINLAAKFSDQLNRLKVEELALVNMLRMRSTGDEEENEDVKPECSTLENVDVHENLSEVKEELNPEEDNLVPIDLQVASAFQYQIQNVEEEEEEEEFDFNNQKIT